MKILTIRYLYDKTLGINGFSKEIIVVLNCFKNYCMGRNTIFTSNKSQFFSCSSFYRYLILLHFHTCCQHSLHLWNMRIDFRFCKQIVESILISSNPFARIKIITSFNKIFRVNTFIIGRSVWKMKSNISHVCSS